MLSVVFIGPGKFKPDCLGLMFCICECKVWCFLLWLKEHNWLYGDMALDQSIMDLYPEDDVLPDLHHGGFEDHESKINCDSLKRWQASQNILQIYCVVTNTQQHPLSYWKRWVFLIQKV